MNHLVIHASYLGTNIYKLSNMRGNAYNIGNTSNYVTTFRRCSYYSSYGTVNGGVRIILGDCDDKVNKKV